MSAQLKPQPAVRVGDYVVVKPGELRAGYRFTVDYVGRNICGEEIIADIRGGCWLPSEVEPFDKSRHYV